LRPLCMKQMRPLNICHECEGALVPFDGIPIVEN